PVVVSSLPPYMAGVYGLATVAFVGGSLIPHGGHATIEPAGLARPVVFGPHTENFRDVNEELLAHDAARLVADGAELECTLRELLTDPEAAAALGRRAREVVDKHRGATRRTLDALERFFTAPKR
ncbi:3-deoxy-D-manno-octulosonic acid transferase, partial [Planctomycetota bacterium]